MDMMFLEIARIFFLSSSKISPFRKVNATIITLLPIGLFCLYSINKHT
jgi:hypothetical protein